MSDVLSPVQFVMNGCLVLVDPPLESMTVATAHEMAFRELAPSRLPPALLPPEINACALVYSIGAQEPAIISPLARDPVFVASRVRSGGQGAARDVNPIAGAVSLAVPPTAIAFEVALSVEPSGADQASLESTRRSPWIRSHAAR